MKMFRNRLNSFVKRVAAILALSIFLLTTACESNQGRHDTENNQDSAGEDNLSTSDPDDSTAVLGQVRRDSTPASNTNADDTPIVDKGVSTDSAQDNDDQKRRK